MNAIKAVVMAGALAMAAGASRAETIWYKGWGDRFDYSKYASWQYTSVAVDFGVWPVAPGHTAGAVYTDDGWATVTWQGAQWVANVNNPYGSRDEAWSVRLFGGGCPTMGCGFTPFTFEFALYVQNSAGAWAWDNNRGLNHRISIR